MRDIKLYKSNTSKYIYLIFFPIFYSLFMLERIKKISFINVDGHLVSNEFIIVSTVFLIAIAIRKIKIQRRHLFLAMLLMMFFFVGLLGIYKVENVSQALYGLIMIFLPMLMIFITTDIKKKELILIIKIIIVLVSVYALFSILLVSNFSFFMKLIGNYNPLYDAYDQYRAPLMLGSSITVSYFYNLSLPFQIYGFSIFKKRWKKIALISIILNIFATTLLLSRLSFIIMIVVLLYTSISQLGYKKVLKFLVVIGLFIYLGIIIFGYDLSRLTYVFDLTHVSTITRISAGSLSFQVFKDNPLLGSGIGSVFPRVFESRYVSYESLVGLVDPHNTYLFILSEMGLIGFINFLWILLFISYQILQQKKVKFRKLGLILMVAFLLSAIGGSHIINEVSLSLIIWFYFGILFNYSSEDCRYDESLIT